MTAQILTDYFEIYLLTAALHFLPNLGLFFYLMVGVFHTNTYFKYKNSNCDYLFYTLIILSLILDN